MTDQTDMIRTILTEVDAILRKRLAKSGAEDLAHILVGVRSDGTTFVSGNVEPEGLKALALDLAEAADEAMNRPSDDKPIH